MSATLDEVKAKLAVLKARKLALDQKATQYLMKANDLEEGPICRLEGRIARMEGR